MLPKTLVLDEEAFPKTFDELVELASTTFRVEHERTTLESIALRPDGTVVTPAGEWRVTRNFLEGAAKAIEIPLPYAYKTSPNLFCENFLQRQVDATLPITISRVGEVVTGLILDRKSRYRPASTGDVLRAIRSEFDWELRRASISFGGVDVELVLPGRVVEPAIGDVIEVGVSLTNSESGDRQLKAAAYSYRLRCTNGAIMSDQMGFARWPNDPRMTDAGSLRSFKQGLAKLSERLEPVAALYMTAVERRLPDDEYYNLWRRVAYHLPRTEADDVLGLDEQERQMLQQTIRERNPLESAELTDQYVYDIHNRITHAAHGRAVGVRRALQEIGGDLLSRAAMWPPVPSMN